MRWIERVSETTSWLLTRAAAPPITLLLLAAWLAGSDQPYQIYGAATSVMLLVLMTASKRRSDLAVQKKLNEIGEALARPDVKKKDRQSADDLEPNT